ncbi:hypothetical protein [Mycoplasmopsis verecunda]|uniref:Uncharacterized protein n=1 Tax=Mycoplasmopsis verecunda TaxID=171291 RepID=A0A1T4LG73_9BACT|nr:hypothetical protein [Mycoplasmopsis verecunda]WPB54852.1 hypothetical protein SAM46_01705 [Mycoplasmopsis verecunda]SJZ53626.1 hypothetical protein SAMN02745154_00441 [Mycoplasmopsis verecunda]
MLNSYRKYNSSTIGGTSTAASYKILTNKQKYYANLAKEINTHIYDLNVYISSLLSSFSKYNLADDTLKESKESYYRKFAILDNIETSINKLISALKENLKYLSNNKDKELHNQIISLLDEFKKSVANEKDYLTSKLSSFMSRNSYASY